MATDTPAPNDRYLRIFESLGLPVVVVSRVGCIRDLNEQAAHLMESVDRTVTGRLLEDIAPWLWAGSRPAVERATAERADTTVLLDAQVRGVECNYEIRVFPIREIDPGDAEAVITIHDQTEIRRKNIELEHTRAELERAGTAKSEFLAHMSHELRTPLNGVIGFAEYLLSGGEESAEERRNVLQRIEKSGRHLLDLINGVLDMAVVESGGIAVNPEPMELTDFAQDIRDLFEYGAAEKNLDFSVEETNVRVPVILADRTRLRQILVNVVGNAIKFTESGSIHVMIQTTKNRNRTELPVDLVISVTDTGPGMGSGEQQSVFEAFAQTELGKRRGGTGLGLAISRKIADALSGSLAFDPTYHLGTRIVFEGKFSEPGSAGISAGVDGEEVSYHGRRCSVLVVDDFPDSRFLVGKMLERMDCTVQEAANGRELLRVLEREQPDMILADLRMPILDGFDAIARIRKEKECRAYLVAMTAGDQPGVRERAINSGFHAYLPKPIRPSAIRRIIDEIARRDRIDLTDVPEEWISEFRSVVRQLDGRRAIELLETGPLPVDLASRFIGLIEGFYFDQVRDLIGMDSKEEM